MAVEEVNQSCFHEPLIIPIYPISNSNSEVYMKRFLIDNLYIVQMTSCRSLPNILTYIYPLGGMFQNIQYTRSVRKVSDRFLCEHLMDYNLARLHEPTLKLSAHA